jgi:DNA protecting protein DprA
MNYSQNELDNIFWSLQIGLTAAQKRRTQSLLTPKHHCLFESATPDAMQSVRHVELMGMLLRAQKKAELNELGACATESTGALLINYFRLIDEYSKTSVPGCPLALSMRGNPMILGRPSVAIIGSRLPTYGGRQLAWQIAHDLALAGFAIWSGGAIGIDTVALKGALAAIPGAQPFGTTAGVVLGSGLDNPYPPSNKPLFQDEGITLISEFPLQQRAQPYCFPMRNFTLAWLVDYIVVIESQKNSGSLITADCAASLGKNVGAIAWPENHPLSSGNELLIESGADVITCAEDVITQFNKHCAPSLHSKPKAEGAHKDRFFTREQIVAANEAIQ